MSLLAGVSVSCNDLVCLLTHSRESLSSKKLYKLSTSYGIFFTMNYYITYLIVYVGSTMRISWINLENQNQEDWARKYLLKKRGGMTQSKEGVNASLEWAGSGDALSFLLKLASNEASEASVVLLKKMELSWIQQKNKHRFKKTLPVNISIQSSKQLKCLAKSLRMTKVKTMEEIIANQVNYQKQVIVQQKDLHGRRKQKLEQCEIDLQIVETNKRHLEQKLERLEARNEKLRSQISEQKKEIEVLKAQNQKISALFPGS